MDRFAHAEALRLVVSVVVKTDWRSKYFKGDKRVAGLQGAEHGVAVEFLDLHEVRKPAHRAAVAVNPLAVSHLPWQGILVSIRSGNRRDWHILRDLTPLGQCDLVLAEERQEKKIGLKTRHRQELEKPEDPSENRPFAAPSGRRAHICVQIVNFHCVGPQVADLRGRQEGPLDMCQANKTAGAAPVSHTRAKRATGVGVACDTQRHDVILRAGQHVHVVAIWAMLNALDNVTVLPNQAVAIARVQDRVKLRGIQEFPVLSQEEKIDMVSTHSLAQTRKTGLIDPALI